MGTALRRRHRRAGNGHDSATRCWHGRRGRGRRAGCRAQKRRSATFDVFFANVTFMGAKAEDHLFSLKDEQAFFAVESHLFGQPLQRCMDRASAAGWNPRYALPVPSTSSESGCYGGAVAGLRRHVHGGPLSCDEADGRAWRSVHKHLVGIQVTLQGADTLWFGSYHRGGLDWDILGTMTQLTRSGERPFVALADWNDPPQALAESGWLDEVKADILVPDNSDYTCVSAQSKSLLDYAVVSRCLRPLIRDLQAVARVPWSPHYGLLLRMRRNACEWQMKTLWRPKRLPRLDDDTNELESEEEGRASWSKWKMLASQNTSEQQLISGPVAQEALHLVSELGTVQEAIDTGLQLWRWTNAVEMRTLSLVGMDPEDTDAQRYMGRAGPPRFITTSMVPCRRGPKQHDHFVPVGYGVAARNMSCMASMSRRIARAQTAEDRATWSLDLLATVLDDDNTMARTWAAMGEEATQRFLQQVLFMFTAIQPSGEDEVQTKLTLSMRLGAVQRHSEALERKLAKLGRSESNEGFKEWIESSLKKGGFAVHRWCNAPNVAAPAVRRASDSTVSTQAIATEAAEGWAIKWRAGHFDEWLQAVRALRSFRADVFAKRSVDEAAIRERFSPERIRSGCRAFKARTAIGSDDVPFALLAEQPDYVLRDLGSIMVSIVLSIALPLQELLSILALLAKKAGGWRTIAICPSFYRLLMVLLSDDFVAWDEGMALDGVAVDSAGPGNSAERAATKRQLLAEVSSIRGLVVVQFLWDLEAFYDSINVPGLLEAASRWELPGTVTALSLQLHVAPRALQVHGCFAPLISCMGRSLLAGCMSSTRFARAVTREPVLDCLQSSVKATGVHVDDVTQLFTARLASEVKVDALRTGRAFVKAMQAAGFTISSKSVVVSSDASVANQLAAAFQREGVPMTPAAAAEDLGVAAAGGNRRCAKYADKRMRKGIRRAGRVKILGKFCRRAKVLYKTGVKPQQQYGLHVCGASTSQRTSARRAAALCLGSAGWRPCLASVLELKGGDSFDPEIGLIVQQIALWLDLWWTMTSKQKHEVTEAWRLKRDALQKMAERERWRSVTGPMAATLVTLLELGWHPIQPNHWLTQDLSQAAMRLTLGCKASILEAIRSSAKHLVWRRASRHWGGGGLEHGPPDFTAIQNFRRKLVKEGLLAEVSALNAVACGGALVGERFGIGMQSCQYCGAAVEDAAHRYYLCPSLRDLDDPDGVLAKTAWIVDKVASGAWSDMKCLWSRGIVPNTVVAHVSASSEAASSCRWVVGGIHAAGSASGRVYSDGSGGELWVPRQVRRAGAGGAAVDFSFVNGIFTAHDVGVVLGDVPGRQTVPRAEAVGASMTLEACRPTYAELWSDAKYVVSGAQSRGEKRDGLLLGSNGDLWGQLGEVFDDQRHPPIRKVKGHRSIKAVVEGRVSMHEYVGNHLADAAADTAARLLQPGGQACMHVERWTGIAYRIAQRLCFIETSRWRNLSQHVPAPLLPEVVHPPSIHECQQQVDNAIQHMGHMLRAQGSGSRCLKCLIWKHRSRLRWFQCQPCSSREAGEQNSAPLPERSSIDHVLNVAMADLDDPEGTFIVDNEQDEQNWCEAILAAQDDEATIHAEAFLEAQREEATSRAAEPAAQRGDAAPRSEELLAAQCEAAAGRAEERSEAKCGEAQRGEATSRVKEKLITRNERKRILRDHRRNLQATLRIEKKNLRHAMRSSHRRPPAGDIGELARARDSLGLVPHSPAEVHASHATRWCGGFTFCLNCGGISSGAGGGKGLLPKSCRHRIAPGSRGRLQRLLRGQSPAGYAEWPDGAAVEERKAVRRISAS